MTGVSEMVSVFIAHHPNDRALAEALALNLEPKGIVSQLGHTAQDAWALGENAKYVLIIWSESSVSSPHIYEIAATFRDLCLGHLAVKGLKLEDIPATVRPSKLVRVTSYATIAEGILRRAREGALPLPAYSLRSTITKPVTAEERAEVTRKEARAKVQEGILRAEAGKLVHKIPASMTRNVEEVIEVRLGRAEAHGLMTGLVGEGSLAQEDLLIVETMTVMLYCRA